MDTNQIEMACRIVFRICEEHPELCPHEYRLTSSTKPEEIDGKMYRDVTYKCGICGKEITKKEEEI